MLTYLLALVVGLSSFSLYTSAFFYPELYRKGDLAWSGVGLFYALVLWFSGERITGGVLLGQIASVSLLGWLGWQAFKARWGQTSVEQQVGIQTGLEKIISPEQRGKITAQVNQQAGKVKEWAQALLSTAAKAPEASSDGYQPLKAEDFGKPPVTIETPAATEIVVEADRITPEAVDQATSIVAETPSPERTQPKPAAAVANIFKSVTGLFNKPKKNTSTYIRKSVQEPAAAALAVAEGNITGTVEALSDQAQEAKADIADAIQVGQDPIAETALAAVQDAVDETKAAIADAQASRAAIAEQVTAAVTDQLADAQAASAETAENMLDKINDSTP